MWEHSILDATTHISVVLQQSSVENVFIEVYMITTGSNFDSININAEIITIWILKLLLFNVDLYKPTGVRFWNSLMILFQA